MAYSLKEIADKLGVTKPTVMNHLRHLEKSRGQLLYNHKNDRSKILINSKTFNLVVSSFQPKSKHTRGLLIASYTSRINDLKQENAHLYGIIRGLGTQLNKAQDLQHTAELKYTQHKGFWTRIKNFFK